MLLKCSLGPCLIPSAVPLSADTASPPPRLCGPGGRRPREGRSAENSAGSKRRPTTSKGKAPPLEDLAGFKELFQTPHQAKGPMIPHLRLRVQSSAVLGVGAGRGRLHPSESRGSPKLETALRAGLASL